MAKTRVVAGHVPCLPLKQFLKLSFTDQLLNGIGFIGQRLNIQDADSHIRSNSVLRTRWALQSVMVQRVDILDVPANMDVSIKQPSYPAMVFRRYLVVAR
jgi:hypothetical protein